jgi:hypothetical protein
VPPDDALHNGQTDTSALELDGRVQPLEHTEELVDVRHVETGTIVSNEKYRTALFLSNADLDARYWTPASELPGIAEQVLEDNA